jgi:hypothetical protein
VKKPAHRKDAKASRTPAPAKPPSRTRLHPHYEAILELQRTIGNRAVTQLLAEGAFPWPLGRGQVRAVRPPPEAMRVTDVDAQAEREAEHRADGGIGAPTASLTGGSPVDPAAAQRVRAARGPGERLPAALRKHLEEMLGVAHRARATPGRATKTPRGDAGR